MISQKIIDYYYEKANSPLLHNPNVVNNPEVSKDAIRRVLEALVIDLTQRLAE